jgi:hypothetical protein
MRRCQFAFHDLGKIKNKSVFPTALIARMLVAVNLGGLVFSAACAAQPMKRDIVEPGCVTSAFKPALREQATVP